MAEAIDTRKKIEASQIRVIPLKLELFEKWEKENGSSELLSKEKEPGINKLFVVQNHKDEMQQLQRDSYEKATNEITLKNIQRDIYIEEAYQITLDLIKMQPKN
jgi:hypothetical protein